MKQFLILAILALGECTVLRNLKNNEGMPQETSDYIIEGGANGDNGEFNGNDQLVKYYTAYAYEAVPMTAEAEFESESEESEEEDDDDDYDDDDDDDDDDDSSSSSEEEGGLNAEQRSMVQSFMNNMNMNNRPDSYGEFRGTHRPMEPKRLNSLGDYKRPNPYKESRRTNSFMEPKMRNSLGDYKRPITYNESKKPSHSLDYWTIWNRNSNHNDAYPGKKPPKNEEARLGIQGFMGR